MGCPSSAELWWPPCWWTVSDPASFGRSCTKVTLVVDPVGLLIVGPGNVPPYVHIPVFGPCGMTWTSARRMSMVRLLPVNTCGIRNGCSNVGGSGTSPASPVMVSLPRMLGWKLQ